MSSSLFSLNSSYVSWVITPDNTMEIHNYPRIYLNMTIKDREISIKDETIIIKDGVETLYEKTVTPFGNSAKVDVPKRFIGRRVYVVVLKD